MYENKNWEKIINGILEKTITPAGTVGEMGIFTGEKRSASVSAVTDCITLNFNKTELFSCLYHI